MEALKRVLEAAEGLGEGGSPDSLEAATASAVAVLKGKGLSVAETRELYAAAGLLWNASIDLAQEQPSSRTAARTRQCASNLLAMLPMGSLPPHDRLAAVNILFQTGRSWAALSEYEAADALFSKGLESAQWLQDTCFASRSWGVLEQECGTILFGFLTHRMAAGRELNQQMLVSALLAQARDFARDERLPAREGSAFKLELAHLLKGQAQAQLQAAKPEQAIPLLELSYELLSLLDLDSTDLFSRETELQGMVCQVLTLMVCCYLEIPGASERALNCIQVLQSVGPWGDSGFTLPFLSHKLNLQMRRFGEAETELLSLISHEDTTTEVSLEAIKAAMALPEGLPSVQAALPLVLDRFPDDTTLVLGLVGVLDSQQAAASPEVEALVLDVLNEERYLEMLREESAQLDHLHTLLWNHAVRLMETQQFERALRFFAASLMAAGSPAQRRKGLHAQALCCSSSGDFARALQYVAAAEEMQPGSLDTGFLRLKVSLAARDEEAAAGSVTQLMACEEATPDVLRVACIEALDAGVPAAAKKALLLLLASISAATGAKGAGAGGEGSHLQPGYEATISQNLIKLVLDAHPAQNSDLPQAPREVDDSCLNGPPDEHAETSSAHLSELAKHMDMAVQRMKAVGPSHFFGAQDGKPLQLEWMALTAWSAACHASKARQLQQASVLMAASGELWAAHPQPNAATLSKQKAAFLFAAASAVEVFDTTPEAEAALALAWQHLLSAKQAAAAMQYSLPLGSVPADAKADVFLLLVEFGVAARQNNIKAQLDVLEKAKAAPKFTWGSFAKMVALCKEGPHKNLDICKVAEQAMLQRLTSEPALNYPVLAATLRSLIQLSTTDAERLQHLSEALGILKSTPKGGYPELEAQWLATFAWNRGALHAKCGRGEDSLRLMQLALELVVHSPAMSAAYKEKMQSELEATRSRLADAPGTA